MSFFWCGAFELAHSRTRYGFIYEQIVHQMQIVRTFIYFQPWSTIIENVMFIVCNNNNKQHVYDVWWHALQCMQCMHFRFQYIPMHCTQFNLSHLLTILICKPKTNEMEKKKGKTKSLLWMPNKIWVWLFQGTLSNIYLFNVISCI